MFISSKTLIKITFCNLLIFISCNKSSELDDENESLNKLNTKFIKNKRKVVASKNKNISGNDTEQTTSDINNYSVQNFINNNSGETQLNKETQQKNIKAIKNKGLKQNTNETKNRDEKENTFDQIKSLLKDKKADFNKIKEKALKLYFEEIKTMSLPKKGKSDEEKEKLVQKAIRIRNLRSILRIFKKDKEIIPKSKLEKEAIEEIELIGLAGSGPKISKDSEEEIKQNNLALIKSEDNNIDNKENQWVNNFLNINNDLIKYAKIWESYNVIQEYKNLEKLPIISDEQFLKNKKDILNNIKSDLRIDELNDAQKFGNNSSYNLKLKDFNIVINKEQFLKDEKFINISENDEKSKIIYKIKIQEDDNAKNKIINLITAIEKFNYLNPDESHNIIRKFKLDGYYCLLIDHKQLQRNLKDIKDPNKLFSKITSKFKLLQSLTFEEYDILKDFGIIKKPRLFNLNLPTKRILDKSFKISYKNSDKKVLEKKYDEGDKISNKLIFNMIETAIVILEDLYIEEIKKTIEEINKKLSDYEIKTKFIDDNKIILIKEYIEILNDKLQQNSLKYYKALIKCIIPQIYLNEKEKNNEENFQNKNEEINLKTIGEVKSFLNITYEIPQQIINDFKKLKPVT
ncbi:MAG: hypothetical protein GY830_05670 [Bacteroidetes bacterium]|nr:hypothetical protein [Bacteroidota bacterium]